MTTAPADIDSSSRRVASSARSSAGDGDELRRWSRAWCVAALALGALRGWSARNVMDPAGIAYLDMGEAAWRGDPGALVNAYWQPLYAVLVGGVARLAAARPDLEAAGVHALNWLFYAGALAAYTYLLHGARARVPEPGQGKPLPMWAFVSLGYAVFLWATVAMIGVDRVTPDMLIATAVFVAAGILVRRGPGDAGWPEFLLGAVLGLGYLAKAGLFPIAFAFIAARAATAGRRRAAAAGLAFAGFALVSAPLVVPLSIESERLTFARTGQLVYAWFVNDVPRYAHWQGEDPPDGTPLHPTRRLHDDPPVFEFGDPVGGTHPPWYDPGYWHEGLRTSFDTGNQLRAIATTGRAYYRIVADMQAEVVGVMLLLLVGVRPATQRALRRASPLILAAGAGLTLHLLIHVEPRLVAGFVAILLVVALAAIVLPERGAVPAVARLISLTVLVVVGVRLAADTAQSLIARRPSWTHPQGRIATTLAAGGLREGDRVGYLGHGFEAYWARLAGARITAEVPTPRVPDYWATTDSVRAAVLDAFRRARVALVATELAPPPTAKESGLWTRVDGTALHVRWLARDSLGLLRELDSPSRR